MNSWFGISEERMFRKMGYFDDQSGITRRYQREREHWEPHLQHTRQFVLDAMQGKKRTSAAILGSGWLLDVPLDELSKYFEKVSLFDVRHPAAVSKQLQPMSNVELRVCDISCFAHTTYQYAKQYRYRKNRPPISTIQPYAGFDLSGYDFVFSCNVLNQLDILLVDYLARFFALSDEETMGFRKNVQQQHINLLPTNRSCMVADYDEILYASDGKELSCRTSVYHPIVQRPDAKRWIWEFDTRMTYYSEKKTFFHVLGVKI